MRKFTIALFVTALAVPASAQDSNWAYFEGENGLLQAGVQAADGSQLLLKCDEAGEGTVYAAIYHPKQVAPPGPRPPMRPVHFRFDGSPPEEARWRYYPQTIVGLNSRREKKLVPFLTDLADASHLEVRVEPEDATDFSIEFQVAGTREAATRVFESCEDTNPLG